MALLRAWPSCLSCGIRPLSLAERKQPGGANEKQSLKNPRSFFPSLRLLPFQVGGGGSAPPRFLANVQRSVLAGPGPTFDSDLRQGCDDKRSRPIMDEAGLREGAAPARPSVLLPQLSVSRRGSGAPQPGAGRGGRAGVR